MLPSLYTWSPIPKVTPPSILTCTLRSPLVVYIQVHSLILWRTRICPTLCSGAAAHLMEQSRSFTLGAYIP